MFAHLLDINDTANDWLDRMMPQMAKAAEATEELKARDQMAWVGLMNSCKAQVEEIICAWSLPVSTSSRYSLRRCCFK